MGSVNQYLTIRVPEFPCPGETLTASAPGCGGGWCSSATIGILALQLRGEEWQQAGAVEKVQILVPGLRGIPHGADGVMRDLQDAFRVQVQLVEKEIIRGSEVDLVRFHRSGGEVLPVERHDELGIRSDCGGEHVPVLLVIRHRRDQIRIVLDECVGEMVVHRRSSPTCLFGGQPQLVNEVPFDLREYLLTWLILVEVE